MDILADFRANHIWFCFLRLQLSVYFNSCRKRRFPDGVGTETRGRVEKRVEELLKIWVDGSVETFFPSQLSSDEQQRSTVIWKLKKRSKNPPSASIF